MKKNKKLFVLAALFLAVFAVGGTLAYLTDTTDPETNTFTFGKVEIELDEGDWDSTNATDLAPGDEVTKEPSVKVKDGSKDAFVFIEVTMPAKIGDKDVLTLSAIDTSKWTTVSTQGYTTVYAYGSSSAMTKVSANGATDKLFEKVTVNGALSGEELATLGDNGANIVVKAYAIQADNVTGTPTEVWATLQSEL